MLYDIDILLLVSLFIVVRADRKLVAHIIDEQEQQVPAFFRGGFQHHGHCCPEWVPAEFVEVGVFDFQEAALFQVGQDHPPGVAQVVQDAVLQVQAQGFFIFCFSGAEQCLLPSVLQLRQIQYFRHFQGDIGIVQRAIFRNGVVNCGADQHCIDKIVVVARLQRCILPVIGEAHHFLHLARCLRLCERQRSR